MLETSVSVKGIESAAAFRLHLSAIKKAGFEAVDLNLFSPAACYIMQQDDALLRAKQIRTLIADEGLRIGQCHPPFNPYIYGNPERGNMVIKNVWHSFAFAAALGVPYLVVHPMRPRDTRDPFFADPSELIAKNIEMYSGMVSRASELGLTLCTENLFSVTPEGTAVHGYTSKPEELIELMDAVRGLCVCLDTGHAAITDQKSDDLVYAFGNRLKVLHIHGNNGKMDLHVSPFELKDQPWDAFCAALARISYQGTINLETDYFIHNVPDEMLEPAYRWLHSCAAYLAGKVEQYSRND